MKRFLTRARSLRVTLWTLIVPPTTWAVHFLFSYLWAAVSCAKLGQWARFPTAFARQLRAPPYGEALRPSA